MIRRAEACYGQRMPEIKVVITFTPANGDVHVEGPQDLLLVYGLLERAKDAIRDHAQRDPSRIALPKAMPGMGA